jgi:hypothetical protein
MATENINAYLSELSYVHGRSEDHEQAGKYEKAHDGYAYVLNGLDSLFNHDEVEPDILVRATLLRAAAFRDDGFTSLRSNLATKKGNFDVAEHQLMAAHDITAAYTTARTPILLFERKKRAQLWGAHAKTQEKLGRLVGTCQVFSNEITLDADASLE